MFENVKSSYFIKMLFSYVDDERKLEIIKYNKTLQNKININLINYKIYSGKYLIYDKYGIVREYNYLDKLVFEGKYSNGKRNGIGKEYFFKGGIKYIGEYMNGKRKEGKEYYYEDTSFRCGTHLLKLYKNGISILDSNIKFEGEYLNGLKWNGYEHDKNNGNQYKIKNGNGFIKEYDILGRHIFEGEYINGMKNGKGKIYYSNGKIKFDGEFYYNRKWNGKGYDINNNIIYELKNGKGFIKEYNNNGDLLYECEYLYGSGNGKGKVYNNNFIFEGEFMDGYKYKGKEYYEGKLIFEGEYLYNLKRRGKYYVDEKLEYEGEYFFDKKWNGKGYDKNGNIIYELHNGNGNVKEYNHNGELQYEGGYLNGKRNGKGKEYYNGELIYEGEYKNGEKDGKGKYYWK